MKTKIILALILFISATSFADVVVTDSARVLKDGADIGAVPDAISNGVVTPSEVQAAILARLSEIKAEAAKVKADALAAADKIKIESKAEAEKIKSVALAEADRIKTDANLDIAAATKAKADADTKANHAIERLRTRKAKEEASGKGKKWEVLDELEAELTVTAKEIRIAEIEARKKSIEAELKEAKK